ncbi:MAG: Dna2/Cas4 domain-containing protein [Methanobacteriaceae archaeon]|nr:Dna2/Cas4 domain-containing protein [Methanobacteriaceae archaeon]
MVKISKFKNHPLISEVKIVENRNNFPISWLNKQGYCEYSLFLENFKKIDIAPTKEMIKGQQEHASLESKFKEDAEPATFKDMMEISKETEIFSREFYVLSVKYGIRGLIDEIWMTPDEFIIIDDKPATIPYYSNINQVYGYCLAFKDMINDDRTIKAALRERGTDNIYWIDQFDNRAEKFIIDLIDHMHKLIIGEEPFKPTRNSNKCRKCRFINFCEFRL